MNINILVQNASNYVSTTATDGGASSVVNVNGTSSDHGGGGVSSATTLDDDTTTISWTTADMDGAGGGAQLSPMAVHFLAVGALFVAVLVLAVINAYLHLRSQRRRRLFAAPPPPVERHYSQRRRSTRRGTASSTGGQDLQSSRPRMTMRMKPTKMFTA